MIPADPGTPLLERMDTMAANFADEVAQCASDLAACRADPNCHADDEPCADCIKTAQIADVLRDAAARIRVLSEALREALDALDEEFNNPAGSKLGYGEVARLRAILEGQ